MPDFTMIAAVGLVLAMGIGMIRVIAGPTPGDRLMSLLLVSTTGVALLLVFNDRLREGPGLLDAALALAVLGPVTTVAFLVVAARRRPDSDTEDSRDH